jgi:hypothetical protein
MTKPVVFFSHSSRDAVALRRLKDRFVELTGGSIDAFLSSDGQSIRLGRNWLASVEQALSSAKLMFVFLSPSAVTAPWIYFEAGHAYAQHLDVVPVGIFGIDIGRIPAPLSILQGFNITSHDSLNNIIVKANETFGHAHKLGFLQSDFDLLRGEGDLVGDVVLGKHARAVSEIEIAAKSAGADNERFLAAFEGTTQPRFVRGSVVSFAGASMWLSTPASGVGAGELHATLEPRLASKVLPIVEDVLHKCIERQPAEERLPYRVSVSFSDDIDAEWLHHVVIGLLDGSEAILESEHELQSDTPWFKRGKLWFSVGQGRGAAMAWFQCSGERFADSGIGDVLDLLFASGVLAYRRLRA